MSEQKGMLRARGADVQPSSEAESLVGTPIGEYLKRQRLLRGMTVEELSATTRIPLRSLERLEAGYFDGVSDGFVRGFVRTVAQALGLDADATVARMLDEPAASPWDRGSAGLWRKQALAVAALVVVTAVSLFLLRAGWNLLVGGAGSARSRDVVAWRDPIHRLAREHADEQGALRAAEAAAEAEEADFGAHP